MMGKANPGKGYRLLAIGDRLQKGDCARVPNGGWEPVSAVGEPITAHHYPMRRKITESTKSPTPNYTTKPKEPKMTAKKPATVKPKYPAPRVANVGTWLPITSKTTKEMLIMDVNILRGQIDENAATNAATGTKLDRALVDLKAAKARIKELEAAK